MVVNMINIRFRKNSKKGFTLVELIVVLVILAILAAILVPALLGWIDKAKEKQILLDARNAYMALQEVVTEDYARPVSLISDGDTSISNELLDKIIDDIRKLSDISDDADIGYIVLDNHKVIGMSYLNDTVGLAATLKDGAWNIVPYP